MQLQPLPLSCNGAIASGGRCCLATCNSFLALYALLRICPHRCEQNISQLLINKGVALNRTRYKGQLIVAGPIDIFGDFDYFYLYAAPCRLWSRSLNTERNGGPTVYVINVKWCGSSDNCSRSIQQSRLYIDVVLLVVTIFQFSTHRKRCS